MSAERVTVSLPAEVLAQARGAVAAGEAESVSAYVAQALAARQSKARALARLDEVLGGRPSVAALNEVRAQLGLPLLPTA
ncbi:hypothetical protein GCM10023201_11490 [Actinomycetospora corticicola]|uniref:Arc/MetJ-type ribon-helix-helix transcriptional regulator n=1 Tax=Actinomycetospora corticicola TaxID=663602 RepID=A0A7Y9DT94_9PSEU|nr:hypothetical protein [Actinomycetospora corticicola]NYD35014.1 Arc/MetJ-type ribon-helix-helix transcriptional regulator [Actinomycetospora corticicola]